MTDQLEMFISDPRLKESGRRKVNISGGQLSILRWGIIIFKPLNTRLRNTLYVLRLGANLIFILKILKDNYEGKFDNKSI